MENYTNIRWSEFDTGSISIYLLFINFRIPVRKFHDEPLDLQSNHRKCLSKPPPTHHWFTLQSERNWYDDLIVYKDTWSNDKDFKVDTGSNSLLWGY